jgi:hypothetical protein
LVLSAQTLSAPNPKSSHTLTLLGLNTIDASAVGEVNFMLNSDDQVFALGATAYSNSHAVGLPCYKLIYMSAEPLRVDINEIDGVRYRVTKLMKHAPFFVCPGRIKA